MIKIYYIIFILIFSVSSTVYSQEKQEQAEKKPFIVFKPDSIDDGRPLLTPFITPGYTPELGGIFAGGGFLSFKTDINNKELLRSTLPITFSYSTSGALTLISKPTLYFKNNRLIIETELWYKSMPDNYFGVGYEQTANKEVSEETNYHRDWWWISPKVFWELKNDFFIGGGLDFNYTKGSEASPEILAEENYIKYNDRPYNSGMGIYIRYDTRDLPADSYSGSLIDIRTTFFGSLMGGNNVYQVYELDMRKFIQVGKYGQTIALQGRIRYGRGEIPYGEMSQLGSPTDLRGYLWGQLRDKSMAYVITEYRHKIYWEDQVTRHSLVGWGAIGTIFSNDTETYYGVPNYGFGYRLEIQPRTSLRLDYGIGKNTSGFYFNFQQAF